MNKCKMFITYPCRSDIALTNPIVKRLKNEEWCKLEQSFSIPGEYLKSYQHFEDIFKTQQFDLVIIIGDRIEQLALAQCAFLHNIPIAVYGSGITNTIATWDDITRHQIALMADVCLCEDVPSCHRVMRLRYALDIAKESKIFEKTYFYDYNVYYVGNLYLDTLYDNIDESLVPAEPYDLVLLNPETLSKTEEDEFSFESNKQVIVIGSNPDQKDAIFDFEVDIFYDNLPRPQFLGLLKNCSKFFTNSSSAYYEAMPLGLKRKQIILVGNRNKGRSTPMEWKQDYKTSDKIVEILKEWWEDKQDV